MLAKLLKPNVASFGYAVFLAVNATSIWGGAFPLLPIEFQTFNVLVLFFLVESLAFLLMLLAGMAGVWFFTNIFGQRTVLATTLVVFLGSLCLIAPLYLWEQTLPLVTVGAILIGLGSAMFFMLWQRAFASQQPERGNLDLMVGTAVSAIIYLLLHIIPIAVASFCITFIAIPLSGLCLSLATRSIDLHQPMFEDAPRENRRVYTNTIRFLWRSALCVGSFGFASGVARALALADPSLGLVVNLVQMAGALVSALVLIALWQRYSFRFDTVFSFRTIFPLVVTAFLFLPFFGLGYSRVFASLVYAFFAFALMVMVIQCAQTSRDHGINPVFIYGFFAAVVYGLQSLGFLVGYLSTPLAGSELSRLAILALLCVWFLAITLYFVRGQLRKTAGEPAASGVESIEFIALANDAKDSQAPVQLANKSAQKATAALEDKHYRDRVSKQCAQVGQHFKLTARETEVMELIARGNSVAHIAEELVVSENTIRTHSKRLYIKLAVHKRQEILDLLEEMGGG